MFYRKRKCGIVLIAEPEFIISKKGAGEIAGRIVVHTTIGTHQENSMDDGRSLPTVDRYTGGLQGVEHGLTDDRGNGRGIIGKRRWWGYNVFLF